MSEGEGRDRADGARSDMDHGEEVFVAVVCRVDGSTDMIGDCGRDGLRDVLPARFVEEGEPVEGCVCEDGSG